MYDSGIGGIGGGTPGASGSSGGGVVPVGGSTSAVNNDTWGEAIQVVYGCATIKGVPLMLQVVSGQETGDVALDGVNTETSVPVARAQYGLASGPVASVDGVVYEKRLYGPAAIAFHQIDWDYISAGPASYGPTFPLGDVATAAEWSELTGAAADYRIPFGHIATMRCARLGCPDGTAAPPDLKAVVSGFFSDRNNVARENYLGDLWTINDANPADVLKDLIENTVYGLGFPAGTVIVDVGSDGLAASSYETYCDAFGLWIAIGIDKTVQVAEVVAQILTATNAVGFWEGNSFKVVPLGDVAKTANGVTYTPVSTALAIDDDVLILEGENPVLVRRRPLVDTFNSVPVLWSRDTVIRDVEMVTSEVPDTANVDAFGMRRADAVELPCIRTLEHARFISKILTDRSLYARDTWEFRVNPRAAAVLQVGDMVSLTHAAMDVAGEILRVVETDEDDRGELTVKAVKWLSTTEITVIELAEVVDDGVPPPPPPIIPIEDTEIVHIGVMDGEIHTWAGPTWAQGPAGPPFASDAANLFGGAMSRQGLTGFTSRIFLALAANNVMETAYQNDRWVLTLRVHHADRWGRGSLLRQPVPVQPCESQLREPGRAPGPKHGGGRHESGAYGLGCEHGSHHHELDRRCSRIRQGLRRARPDDGARVVHVDHLQAQ